MSWKVITPPDGFPVLLSEAKKHVKQDLDVDDVEITQMLGAAVTHAQNFQGKQYLTATIDEFFDGFPRRELTLSLEPVQSITSITYFDTAGDSQTWSASLYQYDVDADPVRIRPEPSETWPLTESRRMKSVTVRYVAGYGNMAQVPPDIKNGFLMKLAELYMNRGEGDKLAADAAFNALSLERNLTT